jgi:Bifunctional DNA primase/polymerase, N-terminal
MSVLAPIEVRAEARAKQLALTEALVAEYDLAVCWTEDLEAGAKTCRHWSKARPTGVAHKASRREMVSGVFRRAETANPCVASKTSGLILIEADSRDDADIVDSLRLPGTVKAESSPGRYHWYFVAPENYNGPTAFLLECGKVIAKNGCGQYFRLPGSTHDKHDHICRFVTFGPIARLYEAEIAKLNALCGPEQIPNGTEARTPTWEPSEADLSVYETLREILMKHPRAEKYRRLLARDDSDFDHDASNADAALIEGFLWASGHSPELTEAAMLASPRRRAKWSERRRGNRTLLQLSISEVLLWQESNGLVPREGRPRKADHEKADHVPAAASKPTARTNVNGLTAEARVPESGPESSKAFRPNRVLRREFFGQPLDQALSEAFKNLYGGDEGEVFPCIFGGSHSATTFPASNCRAVYSCACLAGKGTRGGDSRTLQDAHAAARYGIDPRTITKAQATLWAAFLLIDGGIAFAPEVDIPPPSSESAKARRVREAVTRIIAAKWLLNPVGTPVPLSRPLVAALAGVTPESARRPLDALRANGSLVETFRSEAPKGRKGTAYYLPASIASSLPKTEAVSSTARKSGVTPMISRLYEQATPSLRDEVDAVWIALSRGPLTPDQLAKKIGRQLAKKVGRWIRPNDPPYSSETQLQDELGIRYRRGMVFREDLDERTAALTIAQDGAA